MMLATNANKKKCETECKNCHIVFSDEEYETHRHSCEQKLFDVFRQKRPGEDVEEVVTKKQKIEVPWAPKKKERVKGQKYRYKSNKGPDKGKILIGIWIGYRWHCEHGKERCQCKDCNPEKYLKKLAKVAEYYQNNKEKVAAKDAEYRQNNKEKVAAKNAEYYQNNKEKVAAKNAEYYQNNKEKVAAKDAEYYQKNREKILAKDAEYYQKNREKILAKQAEYYQNNKEKVAAKDAEYYQKNKCSEHGRNPCPACHPIAHLHGCISSGMRSGIKGAKKAERAEKYLGCTMEFLNEYLEKQFTEGMTWANHGVGKGKWNIDHRRPKASFDFNNEEDWYKCWHYTNLQPLWAHENILKGDSFDEATFEYKWTGRITGWVKKE